MKTVAKIIANSVPFDLFVHETYVRSKCIEFDLVTNITSFLNENFISKNQLAVNSYEPTPICR